MPGGEAIFQRILRDSGSVGDVNVEPVYLGNRRANGGSVGAEVEPQYLGAPAERVDQAGAQGRTIAYSGTEYVAGDVTFLPLGSILVPAGAVNQLIGPLTPQRPFRPQKFVLPSTQFGLLLNTIDIEGTNLLASNLGMPVEAFSEASQLPQILFPMILPATGVSFTVSNNLIGAQDLYFQPAFYGVDVRR